MIESNALDPARSNDAAEMDVLCLSRRGFLSAALAGAATVAILGAAPASAIQESSILPGSVSDPTWEYAYVYAYA